MAPVLKLTNNQKNCYLADKSKGFGMVLPWLTKEAPYQNPKAR